MRAVYRTPIPVDDSVHELELTGPIPHVATRRDDLVEVWHLHNEGLPVRTVQVQVFGTGHRLSDESGEHLGTAIGPSGALVWHLFQVGA